MLGETNGIVKGAFVLGERKSWDEFDKLLQYGEDVRDSTGSRSYRDERAKRDERAPKLFENDRTSVCGRRASNTGAETSDLSVDGCPNHDGGIVCGWTA